MKRMWRGAIVALIFLTVLAADGRAHKGHGHGGGAAKFGLKFRLSAMEALGVHMGILLAETRREITLTAERRRAHAGAVAALAVLVRDLFQDETWQRTRAKPEVWQQWARFAGMAGDLEAASAALAEAAKGEDLPLIAKRLQDVGERCTACHKAFRKPKTGR